METVERIADALLIAGAVAFAGFLLSVCASLMLVAFRIGMFA